MEKEIKMEMKNKQGKLIVKKVPESLSSFYKNAGWDFAKDSERTKILDPKPLSSERND